MNKRYFEGPAAIAPMNRGPTIELVESGKLNPRGFVTHQIGFSDMIGSGVSARADETVKVIVDLQ